MAFQYLSQSLRFAFRHFHQLFLVIFPTLFLISMLDVNSGALERPLEVSPLMQMARLALAVVGFGALATAMQQLHQSGESHWLQCYLKGLRALWRLGLANILVTVAVFVGLLFLILPGIYLALRFSLITFYVMFKDQEPLDAIEASFKATQGQVATIFVGSTLIFISVFPLFMLFLSITVPYTLPSPGDLDAQPLHWGIFLLLDILSSVLIIALSTFLFRIYDAVESGEGNNGDSLQADD